MEHSPKRRILFVDDEPLVLKGLQRTLRSMRKEWDLDFAGSGLDALNILSSESYDAVVTDMRMPGMDGTQLLDEVRQRYPHMIRFVLSGEMNQKVILKTVRSAHEHLIKPCDADVLKDALLRAFALRKILDDHHLKQLVGSIDTLPSMPALYLQITEELNSSISSFKKVGEIIARDVGMTAKILQMVNSAFFGLYRHISTPQEAVGFLGMETVKSLVLSAKIFSQFDQHKIYSFSLEELWSHSMGASMFAKTITQAENNQKESMDDAFMAGILHDLGKLVLAQNLPKQYKTVMDEARQTKRSLWEVEYDNFGVTHAEIAAYLMGLWGMKDTVVEAIAFHHCPKKSPGWNGLLAAVHTGNALDHEIHLSHSEETISTIDATYLENIDMIDRLPVWQSACRNSIKKDA